MVYKECSTCGVCTDDGAVKDGNVICHDCLDGEEKPLGCEGFVY